MAKYFDVERALNDGVSSDEIDSYMKANNLVPKPSGGGSTGGTRGADLSAPIDPSDKGNFLQTLTKSLIEPGLRYGAMLGGSLYEAGRAGAQAMGAKNVYVNEQGKTVQNPFLSEEELKTFSDPRKAAIEGAKRTAGAASYVVPFGRGASLASKALIPGAISAGLSEVSRPGSTPLSVGEASLLGAGTAGILPILGKGVRGIAGRITNKASQAINRATPSAWANILQEHGMDINQLTQKYFPKGGNYETALGTAGERGQGGTLNKILQQAEKQIQNTVKRAGGTIRFSGDEFVKALQQERKTLTQTIGNQDKINALDQIIQETKKLFKGGRSVAQLLALKRAADSKFGKAVVEEQTGSVATSAQKMFANTARALLKGKFPEIKDALDKQSEILTLQPILNKARGTANTMGSNLRLGKLTDISLAKPLTIVSKPAEALMSSPRAASTLMGAKNLAGELPSTPPILMKGGALTLPGMITRSQDNQPGVEAQTDQSGKQISKDQELPLSPDSTPSQDQRIIYVNGQPLNSGTMQLVRDIANYKVDISKVTSLRSNERQRLAEMVAAYDPSWDMTQYSARQALRKDFTSGKSSQNIRSLNTAIGHLNSLAQAGKALGNTSIPLLNVVKNIAGQSVGQPQVTRFNNAVNAVAGEMATVFKGTSGTDQEIKSWKEQMNNAQSPEQINAGINQMIDLMASRLSAFSSQWETGMGKPKDFVFLNPKSRKILKGLGIDPDTIDSYNSGQLPSTPPDNP